MVRSTAMGIAKERHAIQSAARPVPSRGGMALSAEADYYGVPTVKLPQRPPDHI
jgi:hypothetical protein